MKKIALVAALLAVFAGSVVRAEEVKDTGKKDAAPVADKTDKKDVKKNDKKDANKTEAKSGEVQPAKDAAPATDKK